MLIEPPTFGAEFTNRYVVLNETVRTIRAGYIHTGVDAFVIAAHRVRRASGIAQAHRQRRIAVVQAQAHRSVVDDGARFVRLAQRLLRHLARVLAAAPQAG